MTNDYLGLCWTSYTVNGAVVRKQMHLYRLNGERRWAETEEAARAAVAGSPN